MLCVKCQAHQKLTTKMSNCRWQASSGQCQWYYIHMFWHRGSIWCLQSPESPDNAGALYKSFQMPGLNRAPDTSNTWTWSICLETRSSKRLPAAVLTLSSLSWNGNRKKSNSYRWSVNHGIRKRLIRDQVFNGAIIKSLLLSTPFLDMFLDHNSLCNAILLKVIFL